MESIVRINVGGTRFETTLETLARAGAASPLSKLGAVSETHFFDRDAAPFSLFLSALRYNEEPFHVTGALNERELSFWSGVAATPVFSVGERVRVTEPDAKYRDGIVACKDDTAYRVRYDDNGHLSSRLAAPLLKSLPLDVGVRVRACVASSSIAIGEQGVVLENDVSSKSPRCTHRVRFDRGTTLCCDPRCIAPISSFSTGATVVHVASSQHVRIISCNFLDDTFNVLFSGGRTEDVPRTGLSLAVTPEIPQNFKLYEFVRTTGRHAIIFEYDPRKALPFIVRFQDGDRSIGRLALHQIEHVYLGVGTRVRATCKLDDGLVAVGDVGTIISVGMPQPYEVRFDTPAPVVEWREFSQISDVSRFSIGAYVLSRLGTLGQIMDYYPRTDIALVRFSSEFTDCFSISQLRLSEPPPPLALAIGARVRAAGAAGEALCLGAARPRAETALEGVVVDKSTDECHWTVRCIQTGGISTYAESSLCVVERSVLDPTLPEKLVAGTRVRRGPTWKWSNQDGDENCIGNVTRLDDDTKWLHVVWPCGKFKAYRYNPKQGFADVVAVSGL